MKRKFEMCKHCRRNEILFSVLQNRFDHNIFIGFQIDDIKPGLQFISYKYLYGAGLPTDDLAYIYIAAISIRHRNFLRISTLLIFYCELIGEGNGINVPASLYFCNHLCYSTT